jgi:hypothetical protein
MTKLDANKMGRRARLLAGATALVCASALAAPAVAGASNYTPFTITQNRAMIVNLSMLPAPTVLATVSWGDVSWSDSYCY